MHHGILLHHVLVDSSHKIVTNPETNNGFRKLMDNYHILTVCDTVGFKA